MKTRGGLEDRECRVCGDSFSVPRGSRKIYCNDACNIRAQHDKVRVARIAAKMGRICRVCAQSIPDDARGNVRYCSGACRSQWNAFKGHGLREGQYAEMLQRQGGGCAICGATALINGDRLCIDHTAKGIRGILCERCNAGVGMFRDDPTLLRAAIGYLTPAPI